MSEVKAEPTEQMWEAFNEDLATLLAVGTTATKFSATIPGHNDPDHSLKLDIRHTVVWDAFIGPDDPRVSNLYELELRQRAGSIALATIEASTEPYKSGYKIHHAIQNYDKLRKHVLAQEDLGDTTIMPGFFLEPREERDDEVVELLDTAADEAESNCAFKYKDSEFVQSLPESYFRAHHHVTRRGEGDQLTREATEIDYRDSDQAFWLKSVWEGASESYKRSLLLLRLNAPVHFSIGAFAIEPIQEFTRLRNRDWYSNGSLSVPTADSLEVVHAKVQEVYNVRNKMHSLT